MSEKIFGAIVAVIMSFASLSGAAAEMPDSVSMQEAPSSQSVGLVLSGGGAKGIAHIGVIQALEDHNIPIDYVAGTSMGAIVGDSMLLDTPPRR